MKNIKDKKHIEELIKYAYLNLGDIRQYDLTGPLDDNIFNLADETEPPYTLLDTMLNPKYLGWVAKEILNIDLAPFQCAIIYELWTHPFPMLIGSRGLGKSFLLAVYAVLKCLLIPKTKVVVVGAAFRQSKFLFEYITNIWRNAPILQDICGYPEERRQGPHIEPDKCTMILGDSSITAIPIGDGGKIRGLRSTCTIVDELASLPKLILENVVIGFGAVMANPVENVKRLAGMKMMRDLGIPVQKADEDNKGNQLILSGTAYYSFNHFYEYWCQYKQIILSRGRPDKLKEIGAFKEGVPQNFNWKDYSIIRIPYELIPEGFMDAKQIDRAKATISSNTYFVEYGAVFPLDSDGFYKRSLIEICTCKDDEPFSLPSGSVYFNPMLRGNPNKKYVIGIDPASQVDNFSIVIIELNEDHIRIVYVWTTNAKSHKAMLKEKQTDEDNFYEFCVRKIRDLMKKFPIAAIALDTQGGGVAIQESLHSKKNLQPGEYPIWPIIEEDKEKDTDDKEGLHILHLINFSDNKWVVDANHGMRSDLENKILLFPAFDTITIGLAIDEDKRVGRTQDTLEDCVLEIEELKNELSTIQHSQTPNGRDKWDTPEIKLENGRKGRQRKDRYSSLLMANMVGRQLSRLEKSIEYNTMGGFVNNINKDISGPLFIGPEWYTQKSKLYFGNH